MKAFRSWIAVIGLVAASQFAMAAPVNIAGSLSNTDPIFNRPAPGNPPTNLSVFGTAVSYDLYTFHVSANDNYSLATLPAASSTGNADDTFLVLYQNAFNPASPLTNALQADDDSGPGFLSLITGNLNAGINYFLVVTSFGNGQFGNYTAALFSTIGTGQVILGAVPTGVPEPSMLMLLPLALAGLAFTRRRKV